MYPQTLCSWLFYLSSLATAKPFVLPSVVPAIDERDLIGLLVGGDPLSNGGVSSPSSLDSPHTPTISPEPGRLRTSSDSVELHVATTPIFSPTPTVASATTRLNIDTTFLVQTVSTTLLPEDPSNVLSPSSTGWVGDTAATPPAELTEWKVIGIGVITVTLIAILILSISFFDSWWGFLRAVTCGKKTGENEGEETMVPDGEKLRKSWEFKLASEDGHRYPTLSSMESI
jgi:hypothetical protein